MTAPSSEILPPTRGEFSQAFKNLLDYSPTLNREDIPKEALRPLTRLLLRSSLGRIPNSSLVRLTEQAFLDASPDGDVENMLELVSLIFMDDELAQEEAEDLSPTKDERVDFLLARSHISARLKVLLERALPALKTLQDAQDMYPEMNCTLPANLVDPILKEFAQEHSLTSEQMKVLFVCLFGESLMNASSARESENKTRELMASLLRVFHGGSSPN